MTIQDVKYIINDVFGLNKDEFALKCGGKDLPDITKRLEGYGIVASTVFAVVNKSHGGAQDVGNEDEKKIRRLNTKKYPDIKLTRERDVVTWDDDKIRPRAIMSCGHAVGAQSMYEYIKWRLGRNLTTTNICCPLPECAKEWDWNLVAKVADLSLSENLRYLQIMSDRLMKGRGVKKCPSCGSLGEASESLNIFRAVCSPCKTHFCWSCEKPWKTDGLQICGNDKCPVLEIQKVLNDAQPVKTTYSANVTIPNVRACPRCLTFVEHKAGCKFMKCKGCDYYFCMACLSVAKVKGVEEFSCSRPDQQCNTAGVQQLK